MQGMNRLLETMTMKSSAIGASGPLLLSNAHRLFVPGAGDADSEFPQSVAGQTQANFSEGNRNFCSKHKRKFVNFCLDHGTALCSMCFKDHQGHKIEMLENYA